MRWWPWRRQHEKPVDLAKRPGEEADRARRDAHEDWSEIARLGRVLGGAIEENRFSARIAAAYRSPR